MPTDPRPLRPVPPLPASGASADGAPGPWLLLATIAGAKAATLVLILWVSRSHGEAGLIAVTTWPWLAVAAALLAGPLLLRLRLRRVRARRTALLRAEWAPEGPGGGEPPATVPSSADAP